MLARRPEDRIDDYDDILDILEDVEKDQAGMIVRRRTSFWRNASRLFGRDAKNG